MDKRRQSPAAGDSYRPVFDQSMYCGATSGVPTSNRTFSC